LVSKTNWNHIRHRSHDVRRPKIRTNAGALNR
jgi:hypothetical protein